MNYWTTYSLLGVLLMMFVLVGVSAYQYDSTDNNDMKTDQTFSGSLGHGLDNKGAMPEEKKIDENSVWTDIYPNTKPMEIAEQTVVASVAQTWAERIQGLSDTPYLPDHVVKLFIFDNSSYHSIWMKDMNYSIDIIWVDEDKTIVHIEENVSPDTYPDESFTTDVPAKYVIETVAGFVGDNDVEIGDIVTLPR